MGLGKAGAVTVNAAICLCGRAVQLYCDTASFSSGKLDEVSRWVCRGCSGKISEASSNPLEASLVIYA